MNAINKKSGHKYLIINSDVINATNEQDGQPMVLYTGKKKDSDEIGIFVRERNEFMEKFEIIS
jgi:hypothetical protein